MDFFIAIDDKLLNDIQTVFSQFQTDPAQYMPKTVEEFQGFTEEGAQLLRDYFLGNKDLEDTAPVPDKFNKQRASMAQSVEVEKKNGLSVTIKAHHRLIDTLVQGREESEFDMKTKYPFGKHSRVSRDRKGNIKSNYLIICFRWGAKGETAHFNSYIPAKIYRTQTSKMSLSFRTGEHHNEENSRGEQIPRDEYEWGDRVDEKNAYVYEKTRAWKGKNITTTISNTGMVRMKHDEGGSEFVTFRVISTKSPKDSWIRRNEAVEPINIQEGFEKTLEKQRPALENNLALAVQQDLLNILSSL